MNRTLRNYGRAPPWSRGAALALPGLALGAATGSGASFPATAYTQVVPGLGPLQLHVEGLDGRHQRLHQRRRRLRRLATRP